MTYNWELEQVREDGINMAVFVPLLYSIARDFRNPLKTNSRVILEIGVRKGTSTRAWLRGLKDSELYGAHLYSIDIQDCSGVCPQDLQSLWTFVQGDSATIPWDKSIDILLIDGGHSYKTCLNDYKKFEPFVCNGGLILMHDVSWPKKSPGKVFWDEVIYPKTILPLSPSGMGIIYKIQPPYYYDDLIKLDCEH